MPLTAHIMKEKYHQITQCLHKHKMNSQNTYIRAKIDMCTHSWLSDVLQATLIQHFYNSRMSMSLKDLCLLTLRDSGMPIYVANSLTQDPAFDQTSQILRMIMTDMWTIHHQRMMRGSSSNTIDGLNSVLLEIRQTLRRQYRLNNAVYEATPGASATPIYEEPTRHRPSSSDQTPTTSSYMSWGTTWGSYVNKK